MREAINKAGGQPPGQRVVIVGGGTAGWMAAAALARFLPPSASIRLIESAEIGTVGVGEATIPQLRHFNDGLGIDEDEFVRETQGTFKLGVQFEGWSGEGSEYIHAFGAIGRGLGLVPFHQFWLRARSEGDASSLWDHSPAAQAAAKGRFGRDPGRPELPSGLAHAFHFDAALYAAFLRRYAEERGVVRTEARVEAVDAAAGCIAAVRLDGGERVEGDLFLDCTGFRGLLIEEALHAGYDDWREWLPCDRALAVPSARIGDPVPYTRAIARRAGWQWRIPLRHRTGNGLVYPSEHLSEDEAAAILLANLEGEALAEPRLLRFVTGRRRRTWIGNCVALGLAAGFMEPLESTGIHLIQSGIARLLDLWPGNSDASAEQDEFNRQSEREWLAVRDFLILHYWANDRTEPLWQGRRSKGVTDTLAARIALFRASGRFPTDPDNLFTPLAWQQVMIGQGIWPGRHNPLADALDSAKLAELLRLSSRHAELVASRFPRHADFLEQICASSPRGTRAA